MSQIWKSGAEIYRDSSDGQLALKNANLIDSQVLKAAEPIFSEIDTYFKSVEGMNAVDTTMWKMITSYCGWIKNDAIMNFLNNDETAVNMFFDYQGKLAANGWKDIYEDYRQYENDESSKIKIEIYNRAIAFAKGAK